MAQLLKKILISTSIAAGMGLALGAPASAASLTGASVSGVDGTDYELYCQVGATTTATGCTDLNAVLGADAGNVELDFNSEAEGGWSSAVELTGQINGKDITISSLTAADWTDDLGLSWVTDAVAAVVSQNPALNAYGAALSAQVGTIWNQLKATGSMAVFSDPNISYVTQDGDASADIEIGLIGHLNAFDNPVYKNIFVGGLVNALGLSGAQAAGLAAGITTLQASEVVKVIYNGETQYRYSFNAPTATGVTEVSDGFSHSGEYIVTIDGMEMEPPASTPEPSAMVGLAAMLGLYAGKRKLQQRNEGAA